MLREWKPMFYYFGQRGWTESRQAALNCNLRNGVHIQVSTSRERIDRESPPVTKTPDPLQRGHSNVKERASETPQASHSTRTGSSTISRSAPSASVPRARCSKRKERFSGSTARSTPTRSRIDVTFFAACRSASESAMSRISLATPSSCTWIIYPTGQGICHNSVSYTHLRAHETRHDLVCR